MKKDLGAKQAETELANLRNETLLKMQEVKIGLKEADG